MRACVGDLHNATPHSFKTSNQQRRPLKSQKAKPRIRKSNLSRCNTLKNSMSSGSLDIKIKMRRLNKLALMLVAICCLQATDCRPKCSSHDDCLKGFLSCWNKCSQIYCIEDCQKVLSHCLRCEHSNTNLSSRVHRVLKDQNEFNKQYP